MTDPTYAIRSLPQTDSESPVGYDGDDLLNLALVPDSFCDADFYTRMNEKGRGLREVVPVSLFVQGERNLPDERATTG